MATNSIVSDLQAQAEAEMLRLQSEGWTQSDVTAALRELLERPTNSFESEPGRGPRRRALARARGRGCSTLPCDGGPAPAGWRVGVRRRGARRWARRLALVVLGACLGFMLGLVASGVVQW